MEFMDVFTGLGKLPVEHDICLASAANNDDKLYVQPIADSFRLEDKVYKKLDEIVANGNITPVKEPNEWVSRIMVVCWDPFKFNKAVQRQHF